MKRWILMMLVLCLPALSVAACSGEQTPTELEPAIENEAEQRPEPRPSAPQAVPETHFDQPIEMVAAGQLTEVDLQSNTFILTDPDGIEQKFAFSESTEVIGGTDAQGLSNQEGSQAIVDYIDQGNLRLAVRIEIMN